jgi:hypothetical protein
MKQVVRIGLDIAKRWFQIHAVDASGKEVLNKKLPRDKVLVFLAGFPACEVALEACSTSHYWGREISKLGHNVRLISPNYVKPFLKRGKSDAHDARAICEAANRPDMRSVRIKSPEEQAALMQPAPAVQAAQAAPSPASTPTPAPQTDLLAQLQQLTQLKEAGALTEEEFQLAKAKILG